ncbi:hypothetical protein [uncultured Brachyspira sp.]|uniref:hypothetical protein n=2 Tax=uncultured Brachyspira sp. TaxID=221953 RepID=UPI0025EEB12B|nr:hypothetical protein [uncultured Brachyspira sp.]
MSKFIYKILIIVLSISINLFANFEINFYMPLGFNFSFSSITLERPNRLYESIKGDLGFDFSLMLQLGYNLKLNNNNSKIRSIGFLLDAGFYMQDININYKYPKFANYNDYYKVDDEFLFYGIHLGVIPKINFENFSIGLGLGVRIPIEAEISHQKLEDDNGIYYKGSLMYKDKSEWNFNDIKKVFKYPVFPYIKLSFDGFWYPFDKTAFMYGAYLLYDFSSPYNVNNIETLQKGLIKKI